MNNHPTQSHLFWVAVTVLSLLTACCVITYFRPYGFPAFIVSTAYLGIVVIGEFYCEENWLHSLPERWRLILNLIIPLAWLALAILKFMKFKENRPVRRDLDHHRKIAAFEPLPFL